MTFEGLALSAIFVLLCLLVLGVVALIAVFVNALRGPDTPEDLGD